MKTIQQKILVLTASLLFLFAMPAFAIEGLEVLVQSTNAVLSWPSLDDGSETYIVQRRSTLNLTDSWATLADFLPADSDTNITLFIQSNAVPPATGFYRVVRDGAHLYGLTNGTVLSGLVALPIELGNTNGSIATISLTEDDSPVGNSIQTAPLSSPLALIVDTTLMSNGVHEVSASATWDDTNGGLWEADSPPVSVTVSNEISFPDWIPSFGELGNSLLINAQSAHTNVDWYIYVYDSHTNYIGTLGGHTDDGNIQVEWNLIGPPPDYVAYTNDDHFVFYITTPYSDPPMPPTYKVTDPWSGSGAWVIAAQHAFDNLVGSDDLYGEINGFVQGAQSFSFPVLPSPDGNDNAFAISFQDPSEYSSWATFRQALYDPSARNLVYFGHGGPNGIGYNSHDTNVSISATEIANVLHTIPAGQTNRHAFRFVFLDGCSTAKGTLPESFGIIHRENVDLDDYTYASLRPSAFVGWTADKYIGFLSDGVNYDHIYFIQYIEYYLANGDGIQQAITDAANEPGVGLVWTSQFKVYGFFDLHFSQYND